MSSTANSQGDAWTSDSTGKEWNRLARLYHDMTVKTAEAPSTALVTRANELLPWSKATAVLDNGCGSGVIIRHVITNYGSQIPADCSWTAADYSPGMLEQVHKVKEENRGNPHWDKVDTKRLDCMDMQDVADDSLSHVTAGWVYFMMPDPQKAMTESLRILKPSGVLALSSWKGNQWHSIMAALAPFRPEKKFIDWWDEWKSVDGIKNEFRKAGFKDVGAEEITSEFSFDTAGQMVDLFVDVMPPVRSWMQDFSEEERVKARQVMIEKTREFCADEPGTLKGTSIIGWGRK